MSDPQPHPLDDVAVYDSKGRPLGYDGNADDPAFVTLDDARLLAADVWRLTGELAKLSDPAAVHVNMLTGTIAKPTMAQIAHIYGDEWTAALATARAEGLRMAAAVKATIWSPLGFTTDWRNGWLAGAQAMATAKDDAILALIPAPAKPARAGQPIETAPDDGTEFLAYWPDPTMPENNAWSIERTWRGGTGLNVWETPNSCADVGSGDAPQWWWPLSVLDMPPSHPKRDWPAPPVLITLGSSNLGVGEGGEG